MHWWDCSSHPTIHQWLLRVVTRYSPLSGINFRFCLDCGHSIGVIFSTVFSWSRRVAAIVYLMNRCRRQRYNYRDTQTLVRVASLLRAVLFGSLLAIGLNVVESSWGNPLAITAGFLLLQDLDSLPDCFHCVCFARCRRASLGSAINGR